MNWIKCSERLPEKNGNYLVYLDYEEVYVLPFSSRHSAWNSRDHEDPPLHQIDGVTHWMPLPEGPKEEEHLSQDDDNWDLVVSMARDIIVATVSNMWTSGDINGAALKQAQQFYSHVEVIEKFAKKVAKGDD